MRQAPRKITSIEKTLAILLTFGPHNQELGTVEISQKLGFHKATVSRILLTLMRSAFLEQDPQTRKFRLGASILSLGSAARHSLKTNMVQIAKPYIDELRDRLRETIVLEALSGKSTFMAYIAEGPRRVRIAGTLGDRLPIHAAAGAKAILAFSLPEIRENLLDQEMPRLTPNTITDTRIFKRQLKLIRHQGFSYDNEEIDTGISAVGAPIFNHEKKAVAAVTVAGPSQRISWNVDSPIVSQVKDTAAKISTQL
ncbi:MAG: IclR family transcriptional regulator [Deltaproteobacteria bacterium]|nr:IclR family transcriptional regulator [Deltaproteobacteria bacterium]MBW2341404.1 IclR family transcriptional regulator [Deltaproteobacteria bacterium]